MLQLLLNDDVYCGTSSGISSDCGSILSFKCLNTVPRSTDYSSSSSEDVWRHLVNAITTSRLVISDRRRLANADVVTATQMRDKTPFPDKRCHSTFASNFAKCQTIFKIRLPADLSVNSW